MKIIAICHANDTNIQMKDFPVDLILNWWVLETRNSLFNYSLSIVVFNESHAFVQVVNSPPPLPPTPRFSFSYHN